MLVDTAPAPVVGSRFGSRAKLADHHPQKQKQRSAYGLQRTSSNISSSSSSRLGQVLVVTGKKGGAMHPHNQDFLSESGSTATPTDSYTDSYAQGSVGSSSSYSSPQKTKRKGLFGRGRKHRQSPKDKKIPLSQQHPQPQQPAQLQQDELRRPSPLRNAFSRSPRQNSSASSNRLSKYNNKAAAAAGIPSNSSTSRRTSGSQASPGVAGSVKSAGVPREPAPPTNLSVTLGKEPPLVSPAPSQDCEEEQDHFQELPGGATPSSPALLIPTLLHVPNRNPDDDDESAAQPSSLRHRESWDKHAPVSPLSSVSAKMFGIPSPPHPAGIKKPQQQQELQQQKEKEEDDKVFDILVPSALTQAMVTISQLQQDNERLSRDRAVQERLALEYQRKATQQTELFETAAEIKAAELAIVTQERNLLIAQCEELKRQSAEEVDSLQRTIDQQSLELQESQRRHEQAVKELQSQLADKDAQIDALQAELGKLRLEMQHLKTPTDAYAPNALVTETDRSKRLYELRNRLDNYETVMRTKVLTIRRQISEAKSSASSSSLSGESPTDESMSSLTTDEDESGIASSKTSVTPSSLLRGVSAPASSGSSCDPSMTGIPVDRSKRLYALRNRLDNCETQMRQRVETMRQQQHEQQESSNQQQQQEKDQERIRKLEAQLQQAQDQLKECQRMQFNPFIRGTQRIQI